MRPRLRALASFAALAAVLSGCETARVAVNPRADFSRINRVAVVTFGGKQGDLAADTLTQSLLSRGADVIERQQLNAVLNERKLAKAGILDAASAQKLGQILGVDAVFVGTVAQNTDSQTYVVSEARRNRRTTVTPVAGRNLVPEGSLPGSPHSQVVSTEARASLIARMVDVKTGSIFWSASMDSVDFDVQSAMQSICDDFADSLTKVWPAVAVKPKR